MFVKYDRYDIKFEKKPLELSILNTVSWFFYFLIVAKYAHTCHVFQF